MIKKIIWSFVIILVLATAGAAAYVYYYPMPSASVPTVAAPQAAPDNSVIAGPVTAISTTSISVKKQDGTTATLEIASSTQVMLAGQGGQGAARSIKDVKVGTMVLINPTPQLPKLAQSIILLSPPPAQ